MYEHTGAHRAHVCTGKLADDDSLVIQTVKVPKSQQTTTMVNIPDINNADKETKRYFKNLLCEIHEMDAWMETLDCQITSARYRILFRDKRPDEEAWWHRFRHAMLKDRQKKRYRLVKELIAKLEESHV